MPLPLLQAGSHDPAPLSPSDSVSLAYQRVQKVDCTSLRPVLILGPLLDVVKEMLVNEAPGKFCRCPLGKGAPSMPVPVSMSTVSWGWIPWCFRVLLTWVRPASSIWFFLWKTGQQDWAPNGPSAQSSSPGSAKYRGVLIPVSVLCRGDEGLPAGHRARCQRLPVCGLQAEEWPF